MFATFKSLFNRTMAGIGAQRSPGKTKYTMSSAKNSRRARVSVEMLENRLVPANLVVISPLDQLNAVNTPGTLRHAVNEANIDAAHGISDSITFNTVLMRTNTITLQQGLLELKAGAGTVTINGGGKVAISGNNRSEVFKVDAGAKAAVDALFIEYGKGVDGGGIYNDGQLALANTDLVRSSASFGGGVFNDSIGNLAVSNCVFDHDSAVDSGGGLYNEYGRMAVANSTFSNNLAGWGGALMNTSYSGLTLSSCTFSNNFATYDGGALLTEYGPVAITACTFTSNTTDGNGGAIWSFSPMTVSKSTFNNNHAEYGSAFYNAKGGFLTVSNSSFAANSAAHGPANIDNLGTDRLLGTNPGL